jgi:hypothetical protein
MSLNTSTLHTQNDLLYEDIYLKLKKDYDYKQNIFIEEDITKVNTKVNTNTNTFIKDRKSVV